MPSIKLKENATSAERQDWQQKWDDWKKASGKQINRQRTEQNDAKELRLHRIKRYGVSISSKVATREHAWRRYSRYFDQKMIPED
jgi:hypothetical protein